MPTAGTRSSERAHTSALTEAAHLRLLEHYSARQTADCSFGVPLANGGLNVDRARDSAYLVCLFAPSVIVQVSTRIAQRKLRASVCLNITPLSKLPTAGTRSSQRVYTSALTKAAHLSLLEHYSAKQSADGRYLFK